MLLIIRFSVAVEGKCFRKAFIAINIAHSYKANISTALGKQSILLHDYCSRVIRWRGFIEPVCYMYQMEALNSKCHGEKLFLTTIVEHCVEGAPY